MGLLRWALAMAVCLCHLSAGDDAAWRPLGGEAAVLCFFVISGFYMEMVLSERYTPERLGPGYLRRFYLARYLRLYPAFLLVTLVLLVASLMPGRVELPASLRCAEANTPLTLATCGLEWFAQLTMLMLNLPSTAHLLIPPGWSLGVEIGWYAIAPWVSRRKGGVLAVLAAVGALSLFVPYAQHLPVLFAAHCFVMGAVAWRLRERLVIDARWASPWLLRGLVLVAVGLALPAEWTLGAFDPHAHNQVDRLVYPVLTALIVPSLHLRASAERWDHWLGQLSYPLYLVHQAVIDGARHASSRLGVSGVIVSALLLAMLMMWAEHRWIEPRRRLLAL